jgi:hypothetical protein
MDRERFKKKYILGLLSRPLFLCLTVGGLTALAIFPLLNLPPGWSLLGLASILLGTGILFQDFIMGNKKIAFKAQMEMEQEDRLEQNKALLRLESLLAQDQDPRTDRALQDLKALADAYKVGDKWVKQPSQDAYGLAQTVDAIIRQCIESLKSTININQTAKTAATEEVKKVILAQRDRIIHEVQESIARLSHTLGQLQLLNSGATQEVRLDDLGKELLMQLEIAKNVDSRLNSLDLKDTTIEMKYHSSQAQEPEKTSQ